VDFGGQRGGFFQRQFFLQQPRRNSSY
jgi:hypothetical protein